MCRHTQAPNRRQMIAMLAIAPVLAACKPQDEGPEEIRWGREVCSICGMIISEPNFAAEVRGGPDRALLKFDDVGDAVHWLEIQPWKDEPEVEFWVRDYETGSRWLDARQARYMRVGFSPMDYGFGATESSGPDTLGFDEMYAEVIKRGLTSRCVPTDGSER